MPNQTYKVENLIPFCTGKAGKVPQTYSYWLGNNETDAELTADNFFPPKSGLKNGDQIILYSLNYATQRTSYITSTVAGIIKLNIR